MNDNYSQLQNRLAVATDRNNSNGERRAELLAKIKKEHGCDNLEELRALREKTVAELEELGEKREAAKQQAVEAVEEVEAAVMGRSTVQS